MARFLDVHRITEGAVEAYFLANPTTYKPAGGTSIEVETGVKAPDTPGEYGFNRVYSIAQLLKGTEFERAFIHYKVGGKPKVAKIIAAKSKMATLLVGNISYKGDATATVRRKLDRSFF